MIYFIVFGQFFPEIFWNMKLQKVNMAERAPFSAQYEFSDTSNHNVRSNVPLRWSVKLVGWSFSRSLSYLVKQIVVTFLFFCNRHWFEDKWNILKFSYDQID